MPPGCDPEVSAQLLSSLQAWEQTDQTLKSENHSNDQ